MRRGRARSRSTSTSGQSFDYVVTVCDQARQICPVFPGVHESLHWGYEDPAEAEGTDEERLAVFRKVFIQLGERVQQFATVTPAAAGLMLLHLLRHAARRRPARPGTGRTRPGRSATRAGPRPSGSARSSPASAFEPDAVITSPKLRAAQTAEIVAEHLGVDVVERRAPGRRRSTSQALEAILRDARRSGATDPRRSRPGLQRPRRRACATRANVPMRKGALARIDVDRPLRAGAGTLRWLIPPDALKPER